ncbi:MAG TPA: flavodoxin domain-containing protein [Methanoregula sp.]|nr:flavodoxin domain-containing protein [Methanoregula sp.]
MTARILVAYVSQKGSTAEIARAVGKELESAGCRVDVAELNSISSLAHYDAVVIGAPVYMGRISGDVAGFIARHKDAIARLPVAGFVTGIAPVFPKAGNVSTFTGQLAVALTPLHPVALTMFAGRLDAQQLSFVERGMVSLLKAPTGDFRNWDAIAAWAGKLPPLLKI